MNGTRPWPSRPLETYEKRDEITDLKRSGRRAKAVVDELKRRAIAERPISSVGKGESTSVITPEVDETARSLNRRVEIKC